MSPRAPPRRFHLRKPGRYSWSLLAATNWPPHEHDFLISDLSHRALQARGMHAGFHRHSGAAAVPSPGVGTVFRAHRRGALPARPQGTHPARSKARSACAVDRLAPVCPAAVAPGLEGMACWASKSSPRASRTARPSPAPRCSKHSAQVLRLRRRPRLERGSKTYVKTIRDRGKSFRQVRRVSVIAHGRKDFALAAALARRFHDSIKLNEAGYMALTSSRESSSRAGVAAYSLDLWK